MDRPKEKKIDLSQLKEATFWDIDKKDLDPVRDLEFIVQRTTHKGTDTEIEHLYQVLGPKRIFDILSRQRACNKKQLIFYKTLANASS